MKVCVCVCRLLNKEIGTASEQPGSVGRQEEENLFAQTLGISENPKNPPPPKKKNISIQSGTRAALGKWVQQK